VNQIKIPKKFFGIKKLYTFVASISDFKEGITGWQITNRQKRESG
jgi:hypothetical protein